VENGGAGLKEKFGEGEIALVGSDMERSPTLPAVGQRRRQRRGGGLTHKVSAMLQPSWPRK
jgi:hypothetical protein